MHVFIILSCLWHPPFYFILILYLSKLYCKLIWYFPSKIVWLSTSALAGYQITSDLFISSIFIENRYIFYMLRCIDLQLDLSFFFLNIFGYCACTGLRRYLCRWGCHISIGILWWRLLPAYIRYIRIKFSGTKI